MNDDLTLLNKALEGRSGAVTYGGDKKLQMPNFYQTAQYGYGNAFAPWTQDRREYVKHIKGSTYMAVGAIARKFACQEAKVFRRVYSKAGGDLEPVEHDHPLCELFRNVNPLHTQFDLWYQLVFWRVVTGDWYGWKARNKAGEVVEIWPVPSQWVYAVPGLHRLIDAYRVYRFFALSTQVDVEPQDMIHIREPSIDWDMSGLYYGKPAIAAGAHMIDVEEAMMRRLYASFKNFTPPGLVYTTDQKLGEDEFLELLAQMRAQQQMVDRTGEPLLAHSGMKVAEMRSGVREIDYTQSITTILEWILSLLGVPKSLVGLTGDYNRANLEGAVLAFAENTINPMLFHTSQHLTRSLGAEYGPDIVIKIDPITVDDRAAIRADVQAAWSAGAITPNEIRDVLLHKGAYKYGGDVPLVSSGMGEAPYGNAKPNPPAPEGQEDEPDLKSGPAAGGDDRSPEPEPQAPAKEPESVTHQIRSGTRIHKRRVTVERSADWLARQRAGERVMQEAVLPCLRRQARDLVQQLRRDPDAIPYLAPLHGSELHASARDAMLSIARDSLIQKGLLDRAAEWLDRWMGLGYWARVVQSGLVMAFRTELPPDQRPKNDEVLGALERGDWTPFGPHRAVKIATTEATTAVNLGGWLAAPEGGQLQWVVLEGENVRPAHQAANLQVVPVGTDFTVGGYQASFPGDARLPAALRVGCRCAAVRYGD